MKWKAEYQHLYLRDIDQPPFFVQDQCVQEDYTMLHWAANKGHKDRHGFQETCRGGDGSRESALLFQTHLLRTSPCT